MTQAIKWWLFVVTVGLHIRSGPQFQGIRQCAAGPSLQHVFMRWQRLWTQLSETCHEIFDSPRRDGVNMLLPASLHEEIWFRFGDRGGDAIELSVHSTFLDRSWSTTSGNLSHRILELRCADTTSSVTQLRHTRMSKQPHRNCFQQIPTSLRSQPFRYRQGPYCAPYLRHKWHPWKKVLPPLTVTRISKIERSRKYLV
jgi:hypothetical protein